MTTIENLSTILATAVDARIAKTLSLQESQEVLAQALTPQVESIAASALLNALLAMAEIPAKALGLSVSTSPAISNAATGGTLISTTSTKATTSTTSTETVERTRKTRQPKASLNRTEVSSSALEDVDVTDKGTQLADFIANLPKRRLNAKKSDDLRPQTEYVKRLRVRKRIEATIALIPSAVSQEVAREIRLLADSALPGVTSEDLIALETQVRVRVIEAFKSTLSSPTPRNALVHLPQDTVTFEEAQDDDVQEEAEEDEAIIEEVPPELRSNDSKTLEAAESNDEESLEEDERPLLARSVKVVSRPKTIMTRTRSGTPIVVSTRDSIEPAEVRAKRRIVEVDPDFV